MNFRHPAFLSFTICLAMTANSFAISFDGTFGSGGKFMTTFSDVGQPSSSGSKVFIQDSGRIVITGQHQQQGTTTRTSGFALAGITTGGILDSGFGTAGKVVTWEPALHQFITDSCMTSGGSILVLYQRWVSANMNRPVLVKFTSNGQPDSNFLADVETVSNSTSPVRVSEGAGGKIYVVVRTFTYEYSLIRLNSDGSRDKTFAPNGVKSLGLERFNHPEVTSLTELPSGKLLVVGTYSGPGFEGSTFVVRFDSDANLDRLFGMQGVTRISIPGGSAGGTVTRIQPDGKIVIGGYWTFLGSNTFLARLTSRGRLDHTFGNGGIAMTAFNDINGINGMALSPDGKIIVSGSSGDKALPSNQRLFVMMYSSSGVRESFLVTNFFGTREASASDVALQPDGKIVIAGFTQNPADNNLQLASARFLP